MHEDVRVPRSAPAGASPVSRDDPVSPCSSRRASRIRRLVPSRAAISACGSSGHSASARARRSRSAVLNDASSVCRPSRSGSDRGSRGPSGSRPESERLRSDRLSRAPSAEDDGPLEEVLQLADVSRKAVCREAFERRGREAGPRAPESPGDLAEEMVGEEREVLHPLPERGDVDRNRVQPVEEIGAEETRRHRLLQRPVRRGDDPHVGCPLARPSDAPVAAVLQEPEKLGLQLGRHVTDLVEEERPSVRFLDLARARRRPPR